MERDSDTMATMERSHLVKDREANGGQNVTIHNFASTNNNVTSHTAQVPPPYQNDCEECEEQFQQQQQQQQQQQPHSSNPFNRNQHFTQVSLLKNSVNRSCCFHHELHFYIPSRKRNLTED
jgi:hypothetical protein